MRSGGVAIVTLALFVVLLLSVLGTAFWLGAPPETTDSAAGSAAEADQGAEAGPTMQDDSVVAAPEEPALEPTPEGSSETASPPQDDVAVYLPAAPEVTLTASVSSVTVPGRVSFYLSVANMDADTLSWRLDLWDDGVEEDFGSGNPKGGRIHTVHLEDTSQLGRMRATITASDLHNDATASTAVMVLDPCAATQVVIAEDPFDDAVEQNGDAAEITCYGASLLGDDLLFRLPVADSGDAGLDPEDKYRYFFYFHAGWGDTYTWNRIVVLYDGSQTSATWQRDTGPGFLYADREEAQFTAGWEEGALVVTVPLDDIDADGIRPGDGHRLESVYVEAWHLTPDGEANTLLDSAASPAETTMVTFLKLNGEDLEVEVESSL